MTVQKNCMCKDRNISRCVEVTRRLFKQCFEGGKKQHVALVLAISKAYIAFLTKY